MSTEKLKYNIAWQDMQARIWDGCRWVEEIAKDRDIKVAAVANGAMIFGFYAAKIAGVKLYSIPVSSYEDNANSTGEQVREPVVDPQDLPPRLAENDGEDVVVLDDILDTTLTIQAVKVPLPLAKYGVLYAKRDPIETRIHVDFCAEYIEQVAVPSEDKPGETILVDPWAMFPYDKDIRKEFPHASL